MSFNGAPAMAATVVAVDVGKNMDAHHSCLPL
jgi:hypothetical protein